MFNQPKWVCPNCFRGRPLLSVVLKENQKTPPFCSGPKTRHPQVLFLDSDETKPSSKEKQVCQLFGYILKQGRIGWFPSSAHLRALLLKSWLCLSHFSALFWSFPRVFQPAGYRTPTAWQNADSRSPFSTPSKRRVDLRLRKHSRPSPWGFARSTPVWWTLILFAQVFRWQTLGSILQPPS